MDDNSSLFGLQVDASANSSLSETSRWAKFFAIVIISVLVLCFLFFIAFGSAIFRNISSLMDMGSSGVGSIIIVVFVIIGGIVGTLMYFLISGANNIKRGLRNNDQSAFNVGLNHMKNYFVMYGVLAIISLVFSFFALF